MKSASEPIYRRQIAKIILGLLFVGSVAEATPFKSSKIAITAACPYAVAAGQRIAEKGGNAVDVALTVLLTEAVTNPSFASLGGGGFAMVKIPSKNIKNGSGGVETLDFREVAPGATDEKYYLNKAKDASMKGGTAVGVPGLPAGIWELHKKYGKLHWSELFTIPIQLADKGFRVTGGWYDDTIQGSKRFDDQSKLIFMRNGEPLKPGTLLVQKRLAKALNLLRNRTATAFYKGQIAQDIVKTVVARGGHMTLKDLAAYKPVWRDPLKMTYGGRTIYLMPPPSSGGVVIYEALSMIEKMKVKDKAPLSVDELHLLGEISKRAFRTRSLLGDPDFVTNPLDKILSDAFISEQVKTISADKVTDLPPLADEKASKESAQTSHISVLTATGEAVSMTFTLNSNYGSGVTTDEFGIALNNEMDDFTTRPGEANQFGLVQGANNNVKAGKRPLSSMSPSFAERNGQVDLVAGAPGGPRIITAVLNILYRSITTGVDIDRAIQMPRVHHQYLPNKLYVDADYRFAPETIAGLKKKGHEVEESWMGLGYAIQLKDGLLEAAFDSRGDGAAAGF